MHYYPEDQSKENLDKIRRSHVCAKCGRQLYTYINLKDMRKYIACGSQRHEGIAREYKPQAIDYESNIRREHELEKKHGSETAVALRDIPKQGQLTQDQAMHILKLQYPGASESDVVKTAIFCRDFGLHPLANEVFLIPFKKRWKDASGWHEVEKYVMVVGIPASRKIAHNRKGQFSFLDDTPRAATEEEIVKQYGPDSDEAKENIISVTKLEGEGGNKAIGFGLYPKDDDPYGMDKGNSRRNMANIRSERPALDRLPGKPLPRYEVIDEAFTEVPGIGNVDKLTGEVVEGEVTEVPPDAPEGFDGTDEEVEATKKAMSKSKVTEVPEESPFFEPTPDPAGEGEKPRGEAPKNTATITLVQVADIQTLIREKGKDMDTVGKYCVNVKHWTIQGLKNLKVWQYDELVADLKAGKV